MATSAEAATPDEAAGRGRTGGVQSVERAFGLLESMADHGGVLGLSQLAAESGLPLPTIHRLLRTLVDLGYLRQDESRRYALGPRLIRLGESSSHMLGVWARPHLARLARELGESANLAMLDGDEVVYVAQQQSRHSMRMFTEVGRRVLPHCTAVGKAMMATMPPEQVREILARTGMPHHTANTVTDVEEFARQLVWAAEHGYALDEGEQEVGVRCVAVPVPDVPTRLALSVSGPATRMTEELVARAVPLLQEVGAALAADLG
ncbi:IclR family transcriptional regulator [Nocardioides panaciterrulae]|uniref:Glycerol operon regulatory protein n=1 Tax=Nocardioides panaciterrulae TaxID=661492 RepID=A0A7Y9E3I8_9ACTN|nr:IclR family transcriptional regulator [Nocardioides panaciterrulae]NYD40558.1 IclR family acetate operon transcriptional repressor [Nocardioides panaciterrulae]